MREQELELALRAFLELSWIPDVAPGPSFYMVNPVPKAREALRNAWLLLDRESPFPSNNNGAVMGITTNGSTKFIVWLDGKAYGEDQRHLVPEKHLLTFDLAISQVRKLEIEMPWKPTAELRYVERPISPCMTAKYLQQRWVWETEGFYAPPAHDWRDVPTVQEEK